MDASELAVDDECFADFDDLPIDPSAKARRAARMVDARSTRTRSRIHARRASSEAVLSNSDVDDLAQHTARNNLFDLFSIPSKPEYRTSNPKHRNLIISQNKRSITFSTHNNNL